MNKNSKNISGTGSKNLPAHTVRKTLVMLWLTCMIIQGRAQDNANITVKDVVMGQAEVSATTSITLGNGFSAVKGSNFRAYITASAPAVTTISTPTPAIPGASTPAAATGTMNYIKTISFLEAQTSTPSGAYKHLAEIQYFDGLGRPLQQVSVKSSPAGMDVIQPFVYDAFGREAKKLLPYLDNGTDGAYRAGITDADVSKVNNYYNGIKTDDVAYTQISFDNSPLNRVTAQRGPGKDWASKSSTISYMTNEAKGGWKVTDDFSYEAITYAAGTLYVTETTDEQDNKTREYKDKQGQVVRKEAFLGTEALSTSYIYDDFGLLRCVVPPKASGTGDTELCYYYRYDERHRMVEKRIPGGGTTLMVYDQRDRLRFSQNALQAPDQWSFIKYDELNRPVITGVITYSGGASALKTAMEATVPMCEVFNNSTSNYGYTSSSYPVSGCTVHTVTFYDNYAFISALGQTRLNIDQYENIYNIVSGYDVDPKTRVTGTMTLVLAPVGGGYALPRQALYSATYYDKYGHVLRAISDNILNGVDVVSNNYETFTYRLLNSKQQHIAGSENIRLEKAFEYDHAGRLLATRQKINDQPEITTNAMRYNELGELSTKYLHSEQTSGTRTFKQKLDYAYNIRGWLTSINDPSLASDNDLFGMKLFYQNVTGMGGLSATPQYSGNIAGMIWNIKNDKTRGYAFSYDGLNRMLKAGYKDGTGLDQNTGYYDEEITGYDKNGNIGGLKRRFANSEVDNLIYTYKSSDKSNQLLRVADSGIENANVDDYPASSNDYAYDANGNMILDGAKNLSIDYNPVLNLPVKVYENQNKLYYYYTATGSKVVKNGSTNTLYIGNIVYEGTKLAYILTDEGRLVATGEGTSRTFVNEYTLKDHLGNSRVTFTGANIGNNIDIVQTNSYYPFGLSMIQNNTNTSSSYSKNKYLYNGKELQDDEFGSVKLDWLDYGARFYDPQIGRWHSVDPACEVNRRWSPYRYAYDNPLRFIDPDGMLENDDIVYFDKQGEEVGRVESNTQFETWVEVDPNTSGAQNVVPLKGSYTQVEMPNVIQNRVDEKGNIENVTTPAFQQNDYQIAASTFLTNQELNSGNMVVADRGGNIIPQSNLNSVSDISPTMVKAWSMQESHCGVGGAILQVNNNGDYTPDKAALGITKGATFSPNQEINLAIRYAIGKGFSVTGVNYSDGGKTVTRTYSWQGWDKALQNYNGGGVPNYAGKITKMINESIAPKPSNYK
jgi:RHS repeat-associated protein